MKGRCRAFGDVAPYCPFIEIVRGALRLERRAVVDSGNLVERIRAIDRLARTVPPAVSPSPVGAHACAPAPASPAG